jgi:hypothetical protein
VHACVEHMTCMNGKSCNLQTCDVCMRQSPFSNQWVHKHKKMPLLLIKRALSALSCIHAAVPCSQLAQPRDTKFWSIPKDWWNMKPTAPWVHERPSTSAVKEPRPSLHSLPGGGPLESPPDQMHTWHHGVGREFCASAIAP